MKRGFIYIALCLMLGCSSDDGIFTLSDNVYQVTSFIVESNVDLNNDGVFSNDLVSESDCFDNLVFLEGNMTNGPLTTSPTAEIDFDNSGNPIQGAGCIFIDGVLLSYSLEENEILNIGFEDEVFYSAQLSNNNRTITFTFTIEDLFGFNFFENNFLLEDGTLENYQGGATVIYTRIQ